MRHPRIAPMDHALSLECLSGAALRPHLEAVASLRIAVFRDWPYLYAGDIAYEREYLAAYARSANSIVVLARAGDEVVGASTGLPLAEDTAEFEACITALGEQGVLAVDDRQAVILPGLKAAVDVRGPVQAHLPEVPRCQG